MQLIVIVIVLLSFIGVYINMYSKSDLLTSDFSKIPNERFLEEIINPEITNPEITESEKMFDAIGNNISGEATKMRAGKLILDTNVTNGGEPYTRPDGWAGNSGPKRDTNGLTLNNLSYKNNYPYNSSEFIDVNPSETLKSKMEQPLNRSKGITFAGSEVFPGDANKLKSGKIDYMKRAIEIIKSHVPFENKDLTNIQKINSNEFLIRNANKIGTILPEYIETKNKPDFDVINTKRNVILSQNRLEQFDGVSNLVNTTNFNLK